MSHARARCHRTDGTVAMWIMDSPRLAVDGRCDARVSCGDETSEMRSTRSECRVVGSTRAVAVTDVGRVRVCAHTASRTVTLSRKAKTASYLPPSIVERPVESRISWRAFAPNDDWSLGFVETSLRGKQSEKRRNRYKNQPFSHKICKNLLIYFFSIFRRPRTR